MTKKELILALDKLTKKWVCEKNLFNGGCAFAASVIAKELEKANIKYEFIAYDNYPSTSYAHNRGCYHLLIRIKKIFSHIDIGGNYIYPEELIMHNFGMLASHEIKRYYMDTKKNQGWNKKYDVSNNSEFERECHKIFKKYSIS